MKTKLVHVLALTALMSTPLFAAIDTAAATAAISDSSTAAGTVLTAGLAITGLFLGIRLIKKGIKAATS